MPSLEDRIKGLPPDLRREVEDFVRKMTFSWAGVLTDLRDQYTSVELQHKIFEYGEGERKKRPLVRTSKRHHVHEGEVK